MSELKPCPFDGGTCDPDALRIVAEKTTPAQNRSNVHTGYVECQDCGARGPVGWSSPAEIERLVASMWNDRHAE